MDRGVFAVLVILSICSLSCGFRVSEEADSLGKPVLPTNPLHGTQGEDDSSQNQPQEEQSKKGHKIENEDLVLKVLKALVKKEVSSNDQVNLLRDLAEVLSDDSGLVKKNVDTTCAEPWATTSTMCAYDDNQYVTEKGVSPDDRTRILAEHNKYRSIVYPPAKAMQKLYWSLELEALAQKWAQVCSYKAHDENEQRVVPDWGIAVGQNAAFGYSSWEKTIAGWHAEENQFIYGVQYGLHNWYTIAHYTQVVRDKATSIGCGYAVCGSVPRYICNYAFGNPYMSDLGFPYADGATCDDCPDTCHEGLCDCNGLVCKNGGELDPYTCTCACSSPLWTGDDCGTKDISNCQDASYCYTPQPYGYLGMCRFSNVPIECPEMCGVC